MTDKIKIMYFTPTKLVSVKSRLEPSEMERIVENYLLLDEAIPCNDRLPLMYEKSYTLTLDYNPENDTAFMSKDIDNRRLRNDILYEVLRGYK